MSATAGLNVSASLTLLGVNVLGQILVVVLLAWLLAGSVARRDPALRHGIWVIALFCVLASPLAAWILESAGVTLVAIPVLAPQGVLSGSAPATPADVLREPGQPTIDARYRFPTAATLPSDSTATIQSMSDPSTSGREWGRIAGVVWGVGTAFLLVRLVSGYLAIGRMRRELSWTLPPALDEPCRDARRVLGVDRLPPLALARTASGPLTLGVLRPVVVLPEGLVGCLERRQLRDVLVHESSHALRRDTLIGLLQRLTAALFWLHPMVHVLNRKLAEAREELCDNFVLRQADAPDYAETLMLIAQRFVPGRRPAVVALLEHRGGLERRVAGLLDEKRKLTTRLPRGIAAVLAAGFVATVVLGASTRLLHAEPKGKADAQAGRPTGQTPLALDLTEYCPAKKFSRKALESYAGRQTIDGLPFEVRCQIFLFGQTYASRGRVLPEVLKGIRIGRTFDELHLIHHTSWPGVDGETVANIELRYADGTKASLPIRYGLQILDWFYLPSFEQETPTDADTKVCWRHAPLQYKAPVRLFKTKLLNPCPAKVVQTMDVVSARHLSSYTLLAATVSDRDPTRPVTPPVPAAQPPWKFDRQVKIQVVDQATAKPVPGALVQPTLSVLEQNVVGSPFYTSEDGTGSIRYPHRDTTSIAVWVTKEGYELTGQGLPREVPYTFRIELAPTKPTDSAGSRPSAGPPGK
jgi:beta-lactamase regulating signal transducer with metallopeptidase domain